MNFQISKLSLAVTVASVMLTSDIVTASELEEVVVQARKRSESMQEVPVAVSAMNAEQIERLDIQNAMDLSATVPNFQSPKNTVSFGAPQFYMRGVGRANNNWNAENAVAIFIDDVYMQSTAGAFVDMVDFESVEVLRGPQGTLYGRNATTGAIKFNYRKPELQETRFVGEVTVGENNRQDVKLTYSTPLIEDQLGVKIDLFRTANNGYLDLVDEANNTLDDEFGDQEHLGGRLAFLWVPNDEMEIEFNFEATEQDDGTNLVTPIQPVGADATDPSALPLSLSKRGDTKFAPVFGANRAAGEPLLNGGGSELDAYGAVFKLTWDTDFGTFKSITAWREYEDKYVSQLSGRGVPSTVFGVTLNSLVDSYNDFEQFTQEFQFVGNVGENLDYVAGLFYFQNDWEQLQYGATIGVPVEFSPATLPGQSTPYGGTWNDTAQDAQSMAIYFDATWHLTERVSLFFGGRQTWDEKELDYASLFEDNQTSYPGFPVSSDEDWSEFSPRVGADWQINEDLLVYVSYSEGYKAGNLEGDRSTSVATATNWLDPEIVKTWELGFKAEWFDSSLRTNVTLFTSEYTNKSDLVSPEQVATADADIDGIELEVSWYPTDYLRFWANAGFLDAEYTDADASHPIFVADPSGFVPGFDAELVMTPDYSYTLGGEYFFELDAGHELSFAFSYQEVDEHYNGLGVHNYDSELVERYNVLGANVSFRSGDEHWTVTLGGDNLTDEEYWTTGFFGSVPEYAGRYYADGPTWYLRTRYEY